MIRQLGEQASERTVKTIKLSNYRILHFATHGLVASETALFNEKAEPALAEPRWTIPPGNWTM